MIRNRVKALRVEKEEREGRKLTYRVIAEETGLSLSTLTRLVNDDLDRVDLVTLNKLCKFFGCGVEGIFEYIDEDESSKPLPQTPRTKRTRQKATEGEK